MKHSLPDLWSVKRPQRTDAVVVAGAILGASASATAVAVLAAGINIVAGLVLSYAAKALAPKPKPFGANSISGQLLANAREAAAPHSYVYGTVRKGGSITYLESTGVNNRFLHMIITLAGHEVTAIDDIYINEQIVSLDGSGFVTSSPWNGKVRIKKHLGGAGQVVDPDLDAESAQVNASFVGNGIAYIYVRLDYDQNVFPNGIPLFSAVIRGKKVYDPRTTATGHSANAALCIRDYLTSAYGLDDTAIDETSFSAAANICDEAVTKAGGGTEARYQMNGVISADESIGSVLQSMMTSCGGALFWGGGLWKLRPGYYSPSVASFTLNDLRGPIAMAPRVNIRDNFNAVAGTFVDAAQGYITADYPQISSAGFQAEDGGQQTVLDFELPFTTSGAAAQRLAKQTLFRGREQATFSADFGLSAFEVQVGDIVDLTVDRYGWAAKEFEVIAWRFFTSGDAGDLRVNLTLRETSEAAFDWDAEESEIIGNNTNLPSYNDFPDIIAPQSVEELYNTRGGGGVKARVILSTATESPIITFYQFSWERTDTSSEVVERAAIRSQVDVIDDISPGTYIFGVRAQNIFGASSDWVYANPVQVLGINDVPVAISDLSVQSSGGAVAMMRWALHPSLDVQLGGKIEFRHSSALTGATWQSSTSIGKAVNGATTVTALPLKSGTYLARPFDAQGTPGPVSTAVTRAANLSTLSLVSTITEDPSFIGVKTDCSVSGSELSIDLGENTATYNFSGDLDLGAVEPVRLITRVDATIERRDSQFWQRGGTPFWQRGGDLFWQSTSALGDVDIQVRETDDDPAGSPVWREWQSLDAADFLARAFEFRAIITTENVDFITSLSRLEITAYQEA